MSMRTRYTLPGNITQDQFLRQVQARPVSERTPCLALSSCVGEWEESPLKAQLLSLVSIRALMERAVVHAAYFALAERTASHRPVAHIVFEERAAKDYGGLVPFPTQVEVSV